MKFLLETLLFEEQELPVDKVEVDPKLKSHNLFIRFGNFGIGASKIRLDSEFKNDVLWGKETEAGLSVYFVEQNGEDFHIEAENRKRSAYKIDGGYFDDMVNDLFAKSIANDEVHIVTGDLIEQTTVVFDDRTEQNVEW